MASSADRTFDLNMIDPNLLYRSMMSTPPLKSFKKSCLISAFICKICPYNWGSAPYTSSMSVKISSLIFKERKTCSLSSSKLWLLMRYLFVSNLPISKAKKKSYITYSSLRVVDTALTLHEIKHFEERIKREVSVFGIGGSPVGGLQR